MSRVWLLSVSAVALSMSGAAFAAWALLRTPRRPK